MSKPTIHELEAILASNDSRNITMAPDGSIHVGVNMGDITGICLTVFSGKTEVEVEIGGEWITVIREYGDTVNHIVNPSGVQTCFDSHQLAKRQAKILAPSFHNFVPVRSNPSICNECGMERAVIEHSKSRG